VPFAQGDRLEAVIKKNLEVLGYGERCAINQKAGFV